MKWQEEVAKIEVYDNTVLVTFPNGYWVEVRPTEKRLLGVHGNLSVETNEQIVQVARRDHGVIHIFHWEYLQEVSNR